MRKPETLTSSGCDWICSPVSITMSSMGTGGLTYPAWASTFSASAIAHDTSARVRCLARWLMVCTGLLLYACDEARRCGSLVVHRVQRHPYVARRHQVVRLGEEFAIINLKSTREINQLIERNLLPARLDHGQRR